MVQNCALERINNINNCALESGRVSKRDLKPDPLLVDLIRRGNLNFDFKVDQKFNQKATLT
jgi:hypothetical protein